MSYDILNTQEIKSSRKDYPCDISIVIREEIEYNEDFLRQITEDEYNEIMKAKSDGWKILKGSPYRKHTYKRDGDILTARNIIGIENIVSKYRLEIED
jgi:hypothetical protein